MLQIASRQPPKAFNRYRLHQSYLRILKALNKLCNPQRRIFQKKAVSYLNNCKTHKPGPRPNRPTPRNWQFCAKILEQRSQVLPCSSEGAGPNEVRVPFRFPENPDFDFPVAWWIHRRSLSSEKSPSSVQNSPETDSWRNLAMAFPPTLKPGKAVSRRVCNKN